MRAIFIGVIFFFVMGLGAQSSANETEHDFSLSVTSKIYKHPSLFNNVHEESQGQIYKDEPIALSLNYTFSNRWNDDKDQLVFSAFNTFVQYNDIGSPGNPEYESFYDIQELVWKKSSADSNWESQLGLLQIYWGATESRRLLDIANQTSMRPSGRYPNKLGLPAFKLAYQGAEQSLGVFELFLFPYFRAREFADTANRSTPRFVRSIADEIIVATISDQPQYESSAEEKHVDVALVWEKYFRALDLGLYFFKGTNRSPLFASNLNGRGLINSISLSDNGWVIDPYYEQMLQIGLSLQWELSSFLIKAETAFRQSDSPKTPIKDSNPDGTLKENHQKTYLATVVGFEYITPYEIGEGGSASVFAEYSWDERALEADSFLQDDLFFAMDLNFGGYRQLSTVLGFTKDVSLSSWFYFLELSFFINDHSDVSVRAYEFAGEKDEPLDSLNELDSEDFLYLRWNYYF